MKELLTTSIFCLEADIGLTLRQKASRIRQKDLEHNRKAAEKTITNSKSFILVR